jgi:hypothetical protein
VNVDVRIERLVLEGLPLDPPERLLLQTAVEAELARLLADGAPQMGFGSGGAVPHLSTGPGLVRLDQHPRRLGAGIGQAIYGSLSAAYAS